MRKTQAVIEGKMQAAQDWLKDPTALLVRYRIGSNSFALEQWFTNFLMSWTIKNSFILSTTKLCDGPPMTALDHQNVTFKQR